MFNTAEAKQKRLNSGLPDSIDARVYNLVIGGLLLYGFAVNALMVETLSGKLRVLEKPWILLIVYLVLVICGTLLARSESPIISFLGYNLIVVPIGLLLTLTLPNYPRREVMSAIIVTGAVVVIMICAAMLKPNFFIKLGRTLFFALLVGIVGNFVAMLLGYGGNVFNWAFVIIFSLYIGFDWSRAQVYPKTLDNAVDSAIDLYLDIINIFIRILSIMSRSDD